MSAEPAVIVDDISKKFRLYKERNNSVKAALMRGRRAVVEDFWALKHVSFEVPKGETFGLIGENGSGKSTMLKCLTKILRPDGGRLEVRGKISALLELGAGFHPELSGRENVYLNGAILGLSKREIDRRFDDIVDFAGIAPFIDEPVKNYSSGMYVRLGFSVAINVDPDVLFVDEVLAVGDEAFQRKCNDKFNELKHAGKTIVLVSHSMFSVQNICDRVAWFEHGQLLATGLPRDVIEEYTSTVQVDREVDASGHPRWGSGEIKLTGVELIDHTGASGTRLRTGERAMLRLHYETSEPVSEPGFSFFFTTVNGAPVTGPNSVAAGCVPDKLDGKGVVEVVIDPLRILPGTYDLTAVVADRTLLHEYDHLQNVLRFDVERGDIHEDWGVVSMNPHWRIGDLEGET
jgi:ABC-type polysaccharide/polyol phosphate transport system ATPase subunit